MPASLAIHRLSARTPARAQPVAARLALQALGADLEDALPRGLPPQALLWLRRLQLQAPEAVLSRPAPAAWRHDWIATGRDRFDTALAQAARPALGPVPDAAPAVLFADAAEMLACLALAAQAGQLDHWWWRGLLGRAWPQWQVAWVARPQAQAGAIRLLVRMGQGAVVRALRLVELAAQAALPELPALAGEVAEAARADVGPADALAARVDVVAAVPLASAVRTQQAERTDAASERPPANTASRRAAEVSAPLTHIPSTTPSQASPVTAVDATAGGAARSSRRVPRVVESPAPLDRPQALSRDEVAPPAVEARRPSAPEAVVSPPVATVHPAPPSSAVDAVPPALAVAPVVPSSTPLAPSSRGVAIEPAAAQTHSASAPLTAPAVAPVQRVEPVEAEIAVHAPAQVAQPAAPVWPWPQTVMTRQAPLLFLINALLEDDLYPDFTRPRDPGLPVPLLALLSALASAWRLPIGDPLQVVLAERCPAWAEPDVMPAAPGAAAASWPEWIAAYARSLRRRLCRRLGLRASAWPTALTLKRPARLWLSESEWVAEFDLAAHDVAWRLAGLDRDPGWLPSAGCSLRFRFLC